MPYLPPFIAPTRYRDPAAALAQVRRIYDQQISHLRSAMQRYVAGDTLPGHVRAFYPFVRIHTATVARAILETPDIVQLSYGFVAGPGHFETTLTRPDLYADYYLAQFRLLMQNHEVELEVGTSTQPIPIHFSFAENDHIEGTMSTARRMLMRDVFDLPDLASMDDGIANGTYEAQPGQPQPLALFTAARVDYSLQRLRHYTGTSPQWFQNFVLFTNYQFYIDEFVRLGHQEMANPDSEYIAFIEPGNVLTRRAGLGAQEGDALGAAPPRLPQMPAYHLVRADRTGTTMVNIGVGPDLKRIMRTGTVASTDNRNWELLPSNQPQRRFSQSRAIALDMESATIAANGFRFRVPYGTLLCVSDKPLHGEIKLPGMANQFYRDRVDQHLRIGMRAVELLRAEGMSQLHSRKLRSFSEVAFQ